MAVARTILITGATTGIGKHAAVTLARKGHRVFATGRNLEALGRVVAEAATPTLEALRLDVTDAASIASAVEEVGRRTSGEGVYALVNNAGYGLAGPLEEVSDADLRAQFDTNFFGLMAVTRAFLPAMRARRAGRIVNVSSSGGRVSIPMVGAYHASKFAVEALSDALRMELAHLGVRVVLIEPGPIESEFGNRLVAEVEKYRRPDSPYAPIYGRIDAMKARANAFAAPPDCVTRAIEKAIVGRWPRARYVMPFSTRLGVWLSAFVPTFVLDAVMKRAIGLHQLTRG
jgi:NAD(P)-dependent dehydrogenase (short-subunit alcohol dehydrogenase family)